MVFVNDKQPSMLTQAKASGGGEIELEQVAVASVLAYGDVDARAEEKTTGQVSPGPGTEALAFVAV